MQAMPHHHSVALCPRAKLPAAVDIDDSLTIEACFARPTWTATEAAFHSSGFLRRNWMSFLLAKRKNGVRFVVLCSQARIGTQADWQLSGSTATTWTIRGRLMVIGSASAGTATSDCCADEHRCLAKAIR